MRQAGYQLLLKKTLDRSIAAAGLVATAPVIAIAAAAVAITTGRPVFFRQRRPGLNEVPFDIVKLRTMSDERDAAGRLRSDDERLTRIGRFLRRTSIDELPQLWCVLRGDLSLVGPRPLLMRYLERYTPEERRRHQVMPGLTGLAVINGRNAISWEEKLRLDVEYVDSWTFGLDLEILTKTFLIVLSQRGVQTEAGVLMPELQPAHLRGQA